MEEYTEIVYALRHIKDGKLLSYIEASNEGGDFCNSTRVDLDTDNDPKRIWYTDEAWKADYVRNFSTEWYNSGMECPRHSYEPEELEVVKIKRLITTEVVKSNVPSLKKYFEMRYAKSDPDHYQYLMDEMKRVPGRGWYAYSMYDLVEIMEQGKWKPEEISNEQSNKSS
jgi:hypothetical protein